MLTNSKVAPALIPAAQYVRMSDDGQQFSIANQKAAIRDYAERHRFDVVKTYADAGKSGLVLKHRDALRQLLKDVLSGEVNYKAILVYDVSRWGRFPNNDEGAHYEFVCTQAGIPLHYCAESFVNDGTPSSSLLKALKRSMAAEYSRELSVKVFRGKCRLVGMGFWVGGQAGYGYRRMMISATGKPKQKMRFGEAKSLITDRVILVPGPREEIKCVRHMFSMVMNERHGPAAIAQDLNQKGFTMNGRPWQPITIRNILTNPKYAGLNVWHRHTQTLGSKLRMVEPENWITSPKTFFPIVDKATFDRVQVILRRITDRSWSDREMLTRLRRLLEAKGRLSEQLILDARGMPGTGTLHSHFGTYRQMYEMIGYRPPRSDFFRGDRAEPTMHLRRNIVGRLTEMFPEKVFATRLPGGSRSVLQLADGCMVSVLICRKIRQYHKGLHWLVLPNPPERTFITLLCKTNEACDGVSGYYLFPRMETKFRRSYEHDPWLQRGMRLKNLSEFYDAVETIRNAGRDHE